MNIGSGLPIQINKDLLGSKAPQASNDSKVDTSKPEVQANAARSSSAPRSNQGPQRPNQKSGDFAEKLSEKSHPKDKIESGPSSPVDADVDAQPVKYRSAEDLSSRVALKGEKAASPMKVLTKEEAMQAFLDRMETELGVEPEQVLQAFAKLDVDMLMAAPEKSAEQFLENLDLDPADQDRAMVLYSELLTWRSTADLSDKLKNQNQQAEVAVLSKDEMLKRDRMEGLNTMSDRFFMMGDYGRGAKLANSMNAMRAYGPPPMDAMSAAAKAESMKTQDPAAAALSKGAIDVSSMNANVNPADLQALNMSSQTTADVANSFKAMVQPGVPKALEVEGLEMPAVDGASAPTSVFELPAVNGLQKYQSESSSGDSLMTADSDEQELEVSDESLDTFGAQLDNKSHKVEGAKSFNINAPNPTDLDMSENIREVINKAQVMVKDGGGEMKIKMSPEGMGELNLKVLVQNGEVKVEMITSSDETKKLLEKGLSELKESLSAHKLNVEHVKIESAQKASDQMMNDRQQAAERGFQQRFLQDFRDQNAGRHFQTLGVTSARGLSSQTADSAGNDMEAAKRKRLDRRLDLVA